MSEKPHIVLIGPAYPYRGGNALFMAHLYRTLTKEFRITFINFNLLYPSILFPGKTQYDESADHFEQVPTHRLINSMNPISWFRTAKFINILQPDLVVFDWWQPYFGPCYNGIASRLNVSLKKKIIFITENFISHESRSIDLVLTKIALRHAKAFLALSAKVENDLKILKGEKPIFRSELPVFGWFNRPIFDKTAKLKELNWPINSKIIMFFGYVRKYKGLDILLDAFVITRKILPELRLVIAGEFYDDPGPYLNQIEYSGYKEDIKVFNQFIPNEEVAIYFDLSDVVVQPYRSATQSGILNMAYGFEKPAVVTAVGGLEEFVEDSKTGIVVREITPQAVADGIIKFYDLKDIVDFKSNIIERVNSNGFGNINGTFREILNFIRNQK